MNTGDKVRVDGKVSKIVSRYASGKHTQFCLDDGRAMVDLHLRDDVEVVTEAPAKSRFKTPQYGEDFQD